MLGDRGACAALGGKPVAGMDAQLADAVRNLLVLATTPEHEPLLVTEEVARPALEEVLEYLCEAWKLPPPPGKEPKVNVKRESRAKFFLEKGAGGETGADQRMQGRPEPQQHPHKLAA